MSKPEHNNIAVWDLTFYRLDDEGNALEDADGKVITYRAGNYDTSWLTDGLEVDGLEEKNDD